MDWDMLTYYLVMAAMWGGGALFVVNLVYTINYRDEILLKDEKGGNGNDEGEDFHHSRRISDPSGGEERDEWESPQHEDRWTDYSHNYEPGNIFHDW